MKIKLCLVLLLALSISLSQKSFAQASALKQANRQFEMLAYINAIDMYEQALKGKLSDSEKLQASLRLARSYMQVRDMQNAERVYRAVVPNLSNPTGEDVKSVLYYAMVLASNGKNKESGQYWELYDKFQKEDDQRGKAFAKLYSGDIDALKKNLSKYNVEYLNINSGRADFSPMFYKNGLVFCSGRGENEGIIRRVFNWDKSAFLDLYYLNDVSAINGTKATGLGGAPSSNNTNKNNRIVGSDEYTAPTANDTKTIGTYGGTGVNMGLGYDDEKPVSESDRFSRTLNTKYHEGPACFTHSSNKIIFTRNNFNNGKYKQSSDGVNKLKLYTAEENGGNWSNVQEVPFGSDEYSTGHPTITKDDKTVYFASDMPGGFGGTDIYSVDYNNGSWGTPRNLGKSVNSKGNEMFPFVDDNGNLYYSSDGLAGLGDLDIFFVQIQNGNALGKPSNLGEPINSNKDDFGIITDGERKSGYLSSNRKRGGIDDDIYRFTREGSLYPCRELSVFVFDADSKMPLDSVSVEMAMKEGQPESRSLDENNGLKFCVEDKQEYTFKTLRKGYSVSTIGYAAKSDQKDDQPSRLEIALTKLPPPPPPVVVVQEPKKVIVQEPVTRTVNKMPSKTKLKGIATSLKDNVIMEGATVTVTNDCDGSVQQMVTGADGSYEFELTSGCDYSLEYFKEDYEVGKVKIEKSVIKKGPKVLVKDLGLLRQGDEITIENVYYDLNQWFIRPDAAKVFDRLVVTLKRFPTVVVELGSHTDSRGEANDNKILSQKRAQAAIDYLAKKGIDRKRLVANGYGESQLVNQCADGITCTEAEHQKNRRTTLKILRLN